MQKKNVRKLIGILIDLKIITTKAIIRLYMHVGDKSVRLYYKYTDNSCINTT